MLHIVRYRVELIENIIHPTGLLMERLLVRLNTIILYDILHPGH
jgi:hypothetical protein